MADMLGADLVGTDRTTSERRSAARASLRRKVAACCALLLLVCTGQVARTATAIPDVQYSSDTKHWYKHYKTATDKISWSAAKAQAESLGGYLAVVTSSAEHNFLSSTMGIRDTWLGATDEVTEGTWVWVTKETWSYTAWNSGEPNNVGGEHYLSYNSAGTWNDLPASYTQYYVVEWDKDPNVTDPPQAPSALKAVPTTETRVDLSWTDNSDIELNFEVERSVGGAAFTRVATLGEDVTSYADTSVLAGGDYSYRVRATNDIGPSAWTATVEVQTSDPPVSGLAADVLSNRTVELTWSDDSPDDEQISVERGLGGSPVAWSSVAVVAGDATSHVDATVSPDTTYTYRLQPQRTGGGFAPSGAVTIRTSPADPVAGQPVVRNGTQVELVWQDLSDSETSYEVERGLGSPGHDFQLLVVLGPGVTTFKDVTAQPETTYAYRVRAVGPAGPSEWTPEMIVTTPPRGPTGLGVALVSTSQADLTWSDVSAIEDGYRVERKLPPDDRWTRIADLAPGSTSFSDTGAGQDVRYVWRVAAWDENGESAWAESPNLTTPTAMVIDRVSISRPKGKSTKPAKLLASGSFDTGVADFAFAAPAQVRVGDRSIPLTTFAASKKGARFDGDQTIFALKTPKRGSSRVAFTLTVTGDAAAAIDPAAVLRLWFTQSKFAATGAVALQGDRFTAGKDGAVVDPPLTLDLVNGRLSGDGKDKLQLKCRFPAGPVPDVAPDVSVRFGALVTTAPGGQFKKQGDKWIWTLKLAGTSKITLDYRTGVATISLAGVELGAFSIDFDTGELIVTIGGVRYRDRPVYAVSRTTVGY